MMKWNVGDKVRIKVSDEVSQQHWGVPCVVKVIISNLYVEVVLQNGNILLIQADLLTPIKEKPIEPKTINQDDSVMPFDLWLELRRKEIQNAIISFAEAGLPIKQEWVDEWNGGKNE